MPFHPPFTHCIPAVIHPPYERKMETEGSSEGGGWRRLSHSADQVSSSHPTETRTSIYPLYMCKQTEKKLVMYIPGPNPLPPSLMKNKAGTCTKTWHHVLNTSGSFIKYQTVWLTEEEACLGRSQIHWMVCPQQLYDGCIYVFLHSSLDTLHTALAPWKALNSQLRNTLTLKFSQGCPKQMLRVAAAVFIFSVLVTLKVSTRQLSLSSFNSRFSKENLATGVRKQLVFCWSCWDGRSP